MEMHQVRYFLAVARTLNFTRAAEECNVAQPSLTRAIKQLEAELGGDLFLRERPQVQLTELGRRMHPLLDRCYESAVSARSLASAVRSGEVGALKLALSKTIDLQLLVPHLIELRRHFNRLELTCLRGTAAEITDLMKQGEAELAVAAALDAPWDRLDCWPLFTETFVLIASARHGLASRAAVDVDDLRHERFLCRSYCEDAGRLAELLRAHDIDLRGSHEVASDLDLMTLLDADFGISVIPRSTSVPSSLARAPIAGIELRRTVHLYGVAGRQRTAAAAAMLNLLRAANWTRFAS
jgi:DNA-binding transcriptional LysR family regulator